MSAIRDVAGFATACLLGALIFLGLLALGADRRCQQDPSLALCSPTTTTQDNITWEVTRAYERRTSGSGAQTELPLHNSPAEQRLGLLAAIEEWREKEELSVEELDERWTSYFGGAEHAASETVRAGSLLQVTEFARYIGAVEDPVAGEDDDEDPDDDDHGDEDLDEPTAPAVPEPAFSGGGAQ